MSINPQRDVKVVHRTTNHEVYIDRETGRSLKISVNHQKQDYIIHGVPEILKEVTDCKFNMNTVDGDIAKLREVLIHVEALLLQARNFGRMEIECLSNGLRKPE
jgi:hypothetical protein